MMSISEMRLQDVYSLASMEKTDADAVETARRLMNSYYRLCALCERNLYLENDERTANRESTHESVKRERRWWYRLNAEFTKHYGLTLVYCGYYPSICKKNEHGGVSDVIYAHFYK